MPEAGALPAWRVGVDLTAVGQIERSVEQFGDRFLRRLFTSHELESCRDGPRLSAQSLAARFAAKEAAIKVLRPGEHRPQWREIEVRRLPDGACELVLHGAAAGLAAAQGIERFSLSLSHEAGLAIAVVLGWGRGVPDLPAASP